MEARPGDTSKTARKTQVRWRRRGLRRWRPGFLIIADVINRITDFDLISKGKRSTVDNFSMIDVDPITALQVGHIPDIIHTLDTGMIPRRLQILEHDIIVFLPANADAGSFDGILLALKGSFNTDKFHDKRNTTEV